MKPHIYLPIEMVKFSVIILLATGDFFEKVSFYTEAELLENWPGRDMLDIYKSYLLIEVRQIFCTQFTPDYGIKCT